MSCVWIPAIQEKWPYAYRESDHLGGYDPYSASKACAEIIIDSYRNSFFNPKDVRKHKKSIAVARASAVAKCNRPRASTSRVFAFRREVAVRYMRKAANIERGVRKR